MERAYPPILRRPKYPETLETRNEIEKHVNELLDMDFMRKIGHNEIVEVTTPVLITWHDGKSRVYYTSHIKNFALITSSFHNLCSKDVVFGITKERRDSYERIKHELTNAPVLIVPDFELPFKLYIDSDFSQGLGGALHQRPIIDGEPRVGVICYTSGKLKYSEARFGETQTECLFLFWALNKLHYYLEGAVFEVYTDFTALKSLLNMKATNKYILRWQIAIQEYRGNTKII
ncbi:hypothetical protein O181_024969 [Austropuccinia psidii MF-1]|uniref:Reverse transcriptase RNase H-like domain-containing protein n=1 Tax=Austropuccinia psidii MF-1 TaxID=1389203 RepID=A0A9Q3CJN0_9BASI|nr:hypothetical protein [Austropuccinia psidii MF-1]